MNTATTTTKQQTLYNNDNLSYLDCLVNDIANNADSSIMPNGLTSSSSHNHGYHYNTYRRNYVNNQQHQQLNLQSASNSAHLRQTQNGYNTHFLTNSQQNGNYYNNNLSELNHKIPSTSANNIINNNNSNEIIDFSIKCDSGYKITTTETSLSNATNYHSRPIQIQHTGHHHQQQQQNNVNAFFNNNQNNSFQVNHQQQQRVNQHQPLHFQQHQNSLLRIDSPPTSILNEIINDNHIIDDDIESIDDDDNDNEVDDDLLIDNNASVNNQLFPIKTQFQDHSSFDIMSYNNHYPANGATNGSTYDLNRYNNDRKVLSNDTMTANLSYNNNSTIFNQNNAHLHHNVMQNDLVQQTTSINMNSHHNNLMDLLVVSSVDSFKPSENNNENRVLQTNNYIDSIENDSVKNIKKLNTSVVLKATNDSFKHSISKS